MSHPAATMAAMTTKDAALAQIATGQRSLVTLDDALSVGLREGDVEYRVASGRLSRVRRGVWLMAGAELGWEQLVLAACLAAGLPAVASHLTAAFLHGFLGFGQPAQIELTVPWPLRTRLRGIRAHRVHQLDALDVTRVRSIPVTTVARTVIDVASLVPPARLESIVNDLMRRRLLTMRTLAAAVDRVEGIRLRRRLTLVREIIAARAKGFHPGDSDPELWMVETLVAAGLPKPSQQFRVRARGRAYRLDAAYPEFRVGLEYEGADGHTQPGDVVRDRRRLNDLTAEGWDIRFATRGTTAQAFVTDVREALRRSTNGRSP